MPYSGTAPKAGTYPEAGTPDFAKLSNAGTWLADVHEPTDFKVVVSPYGDDQIYVLHSMCRCGGDQCSFSVTVNVSDMRTTREYTTTN